MVSEPRFSVSWDRQGRRLRSRSIVGRAALAAVPALMLAGCSGTGGLFGSTIGAGAARVVSAVAGSPNAAFLGPRIAKALDDDAEVQAAAAQYRALETAQTGTPITWLQGHVYGTVTPGPFVKVAGQSRCRTYSHTIYVKSQPAVTRAVACRQQDGTWTRIGPVR
jgi:surface antigen